MLDGEIIRRRLISELGLDDNLGVLDLRWKRIEVILGIEIEIHAVVTESLHVGPAAGCLRALRVRWAHVGGPFTDDVHECHFVLDHLVFADCTGGVGERVVRPSVGSDLMTFSYHTSDEIWVWCCGINGTFTVVVSGDEEGSCEAI